MVLIQNVEFQKKTCYVNCYLVLPESARLNEKKHIVFERSIYSKRDIISWIFNVKIGLHAKV